MAFRARTKKQAKRQAGLELMARQLVELNPNVNRPALAVRLLERNTWATVEHCIAAIQAADNEHHMLKRLGKAARTNPSLRSALLGIVAEAQNAKDNIPTSVRRVENGGLSIHFTEGEDDANRYGPDADMSRVTAKSSGKVPRYYDPEDDDGTDGSQNVASIPPKTGYEY